MLHRLRVSPASRRLIALLGCLSPAVAAGLSCSSGAANGGSTCESGDASCAPPADASPEATADAADATVDAPADSPVDGPGPEHDSSAPSPCTLPGSVQFTMNGKVTVPGGSAQWPDLGFLTLPTGFCFHYFGTVPNARQIRFAPGGELFVSSPSALTTGGGQGGLSAMVLLPDDDKDGVADSTITFLAFGSSSTNQGLLFAPGFLYFQDGTPPGTKIMRMPYAPGDRKPSGTAAQVADVNGYTSELHWPKTLDMADDGTIYVGNGSDQSEVCVEPHVFHGGILQIDPAPNGPNPNGKQVAQGLRNPINVRCARGHDRCFATELTKDYTAAIGGRDKLVPIDAGDDWGFPCCATKNLPYAGTTTQNGTTPDCSGVAAEVTSLYETNTPFGVDFEGGLWPMPWTGRAYLVTHGAAGSWAGARMVAIPMDPNSGLPTPSNDLDGGDVGMVDFATGWDDATQTHGRPAAVTFSADGRLFVANDNNGVIFWVAPL